MPSNDNSPEEDFSKNYLMESYLVMKKLLVNLNKALGQISIYLSYLSPLLY